MNVSSSWGINEYLPNTFIATRAFLRGLSVLFDLSSISSYNIAWDEVLFTLWILFKFTVERKCWSGYVIGCTVVYAALV